VSDRGGKRFPRKTGKAKPNPENENQLYNLARDPAETTNLWNEYPEIVQHLSEVLDSAREANHTRL